jgi:amidase
MTTIFDHTELGSQDAVATAERIRAGELSAREAVLAAIDRAKAFEPILNAISTETFESALSKSEAPSRGPFSGVPTFIKGLEDEKGVVNDHGSRAYLGHVASGTEPFVREFQATGLVSLGRSAAPEFGLNATTEPLAHGATRNPWNSAHSTGGSSGGAAALVAARVVAIAHGSDAAGSIRIPASHCGIVGLKPTRGRGFEPSVNSKLPVPTLTSGVLTRSVRDTAHFLSAIEDRMPSRTLPPIGLVEGPAAERLRIAVFTDSPLGDEVDGEIRETTLESARQCEALGHSVEEIPCPYAAQLLHDTWNHISFLAWLLRLQARLRPGVNAAKLEPWTQGLAEQWKSHWWGFIGLARRMRAASQVSARLFERYDLLLCPVLAGLPPAIGEFAPDLPFDVTFPREKQHMPFAPIQNATGDPAISLPLGVSAAGLPIGVQFAAAPGQEATLLSIALELEGDGAFRMLT